MVEGKEMFLCVCGCAICVNVQRRLQTSDFGLQCVNALYRTHIHTFKLLCISYNATCVIILSEKLPPFSR